LICGQEGLFPIDQDFLAMDIVGLVQKGHGANGGEEGAGPGGTAVETVGVFDAGQKVALDALGTQVLVARITLDTLS